MKEFLLCELTTCVQSMEYTVPHNLHLEWSELQGWMGVVLMDIRNVLSQSEKKKKKFYSRVSRIQWPNAHGQ